MKYDRIQVATYYIAVFAARTDAYSLWTDEGWRAVREELTPTVVIRGVRDALAEPSRS